MKLARKIIILITVLGIITVGFSSLFLHLQKAEAAKALDQILAPLKPAKLPGEAVPESALGKITMDESALVARISPSKIDMQGFEPETRGKSLSNAPSEIADSMELPPGKPLPPEEDLFGEELTWKQQGGEGGKAWQSIITDGFEGGFPLSPWAIYGYGWNDVSCRSRLGSRSIWCAQSVASDCTSYINDMNTWAIFGPFDLSNAYSAEMTFYYWLNTEKDFDYFKWMASGDGTNFSGYQTSGSTGGWNYKNFDLSDHLGDSSVWIAFLFQSDSSVTMEGVYVDQVSIRKDPIGTPHLNLTFPNGYETLNSGQTYDFTWESSGVSGNVRLELYKGGEDPAFYYGTIHGGAPNDGHLAVTMPTNWPAGNDYLIAISAQSGTVWDFSDAYFSIQNLPNLTQNYASSLPINFSIGDTIDFEIEIINNGNAAAGASYVYYYFKKDSTSFIEQYKIGDDYAPSLGPGATSWESFSYTIPHGIPVGTYVLYYWIDARQEVAESDEYDNAWVWTITVDDSAPDLTRTADSLDKAVVYPGDTLNFDGGIINQGDAAAVASYSYYYFEPGAYTYAPQYKVGEDYVSSLSPAGTTQESFSYTIPSGTAPGTYYFYYWIDARQEVAESNEGNNRYYWTITVLQPVPSAPTVSQVSSPTRLKYQIISGSKQADTSIYVNGVRVVPH